MTDELSIGAGPGFADEAVPAWRGDDLVTPLSEEPAFTQVDYTQPQTLGGSNYSASWNHVVIDVDGNRALDCLPAFEAITSHSSWSAMVTACSTTANS